MTDIEEGLKQAAVMVEGVCDRLLDADNRTFDKMAMLVRRYYNALIQNGFSEEQAVIIAASFNLK